MNTNTDTTLSEHQRILKLEKDDIPALKEGLGDVAEQVDDLRSTLFDGGRNLVSVPAGLFGEVPVLAAVGGIPLVYSVGKSFGAGAKQVAHLKFNPAADLAKPKPVRSCVEYTAKKGKSVDLTIVHSDGTTQLHKIVDPKKNPLAAGDTTKVVVCFDPNTGSQTGVYIT